MSSPASLGLTIEGNEYRVKGKKGGAIKVNKLTVPQLKAYGAKYTTFTNKNRTKKQVLNKIYAAKTKLRNASSSGNSVASALLNLASASPKSSSSYNANLAAAQTIAALAAKPVKSAGKPRVQALLNVAAAPSSGMGINELFQTPKAASLGLLRPMGASGGYRIQGKKGPVKVNKLSIAQLKNYAAKYNANISGLKKKNNILAVIHALKFRPNPMFKVKTPVNAASSGSASVNAAVNNLIKNVLKAKPAKAKPAKALNFSSPRSGSLGLLSQMGASGGYRVKGARGPKKVNAKMTVPALKAYAKKHGVNASKMRTKKNILAAIHRKKFGGASSSSSSSSSSSNGPKVITRSEAARRLAAILKSSSNSSHKRPAVRPRVFGPAAGPVKLTAAQLNKLLGASSS
jgi:hypothetical protein